MSSVGKEKPFSEPTYAQPKQKNSLPWYAPNIDDRMAASTRKLLEEYSGIPPEQQSKHVHEIRDKAWAIRTYPCIGLGVFLFPYIGLSPRYEEMVTRLKDGESMLDVGCFLGADFRRLAFDGSPSDKMLGMDIANCWDVGYDLFRDREKFKARFVEADLVTPDSGTVPEELRALKGSTSIIHISAVLHQWDWQGQLEAAKKLVSFSKVGTLVVGYQIGRAEAKEIQSPHFNNVKHWRHNPGSMKQLWDVVGEQTATRWDTQAWLRSWEFLRMGAKDAAFMEPGDMPIDFAVERIA